MFENRVFGVKKSCLCHSQLCYIARMSVKKKQKSHTSARKKASTSLSTAGRAKKAAAKATKSTRKSNAAKKKAEEERTRKRIELTLRAFRMAYESNQRGEFHRL
jgi:chromatin remodeling complex protein RSC6